MNVQARIGLLVPSSNTSVEPEFYRALPPEVSLHTARLFLPHISPETINGMLLELESQSRLLASADVDVIMLGAVAPGFLKGLGYDRELAEKMRAASGKPTTTTATALMEALEHLGIRRIVIGAPYDATVSSIAQTFLAANGIEVLAAYDMGLTDNTAVGRLPPESAYRVAKDLDRADADAVVFAGTNWKTMEVVERLEAELGKPVISTTAASIWSALRKVGWRRPVSGCGRLLAGLE